VNNQSSAVSDAIQPACPVVFYDGDCPLCRREIAHYRRIDKARRLRWVDAASDAKALAVHGLSHEQAMAELHVRDGTGGWHRGIDAFILIWTRLPAYRWLAHAVSILRLRRPLAFAYRHFAVWRYRRRCGADSCSGAKTVRGH
jgi:predicted DCC family thiol-disulfide oxidoreductase YuxK